ncbi:MAG: GMC oxidoreductase, partial [Dehalococcoidia bacterium]
QIEQFSFSPRGEALSAVAIAAVLERSYGTGRVSLRNADPRAHPVIEQRFLEDERDMSRLVAAFKDTVAFAREEPLAGLIDRIIFPALDRSLGDDSIRSLLARFASSGFHPCGTAKMGPSSDPSAVVDQYGICHAVEGLAVADASIFPTVPRANTNLTSIMTGEKVGEWLRTEPGRYGL